MLTTAVLFHRKNTLYGTWYASCSDDTGLYTDTVVQYSWFDNIVSGEDIASESYGARGMSAVAESGYIFALGGTVDAMYFIQPKAQLGWGRRTRG